MTLLELAERCEKAEGPTKVLDAAVCAACWTSVNPPSLEGVLGEPWCRLSDDERRVTFGTLHEGENYSLASREPLPVTASLDAALTLVPEGCRWTLRTAHPGDRNAKRKGRMFFCHLESADFKSVTWGRGENWITDVVAGHDHSAWAATPALALCAAALRARASS